MMMDGGSIKGKKHLLVAACFLQSALSDLPRAVWAPPQADVWPCCGLCVIPWSSSAFFSSVATLPWHPLPHTFLLHPNMPLHEMLIWQASLVACRPCRRCQDWLSWLSKRLQLLVGRTPLQTSSGRMTSPKEEGLQRMQQAGPAYGSMEWKL